MIQNDARSAQLLNFIQGSLAESGKSADARELLGKLRHGYGDALFDDSGRLRVGAATQALAACLPPEPTGEPPTVANNYGYGDKFANLPPQERLRIVNAHAHHAAEAARETKRLKDEAEMAAALPANWSEFTLPMRSYWINKYEIAKAARDKCEAAVIEARKAEWKREHAA